MTQRLAVKLPGLNLKNPIMNSSGAVYLAWKICTGLKNWCLGDENDYHGATCGQSATLGH